LILVADVRSLAVTTILVMVGMAKGLDKSAVADDRRVEK
jgi:hypothetical protein